MNKCFSIFCISLIFMLSACTHPYEGRYIYRSFPHSEYDGLPIMETITMGSSNGANVIFNYTLEPKEGNIYIVEGTMDMTMHVVKYDDINIHMLLIDGGKIVESIRMNSGNVGIAERIPFYKEFKTDKHFDAVTFNFNVLYYN